MTPPLWVLPLPPKANMALLRQTNVNIIGWFLTLCSSNFCGIVLVGGYYNLHSLLFLLEEAYTSPSSYGWLLPLLFHLRTNLKLELHGVTYTFLIIFKSPIRVNTYDYCISPFICSTWKQGKYRGDVLMNVYFCVHIALCSVLCLINYQLILRPLEILCSPSIGNPAAKWTDCGTGVKLGQWEIIKILGCVIAVYPEQHGQPAIVEFYD